MKTSKSLLICAATVLLSVWRCFGLSGTGTAGLVDGVYVVTVESGKEATLQGADASAANSSAAPLAKRGGGTLKAGDGFTGLNTDIRIEEGSLQVKNGNNLGTADGCTVISNGAVLSLYNTSPNSISFASEPILLAGRINNAGSNAHSNAFLGSLTVIDDAARITGGGTLGLGGNLALDGHALAISMAKSESFILRNAVMSSGGTIVLEQGHFSLEGDNVISAREACNLPHVEAAGGGSLSCEVFGFGGNVAAFTKTGGNVFTFDNCLSVTGDTFVAQGVLKLGGSAPGTAGLRAVVTNFADQAAWLGFLGAANKDTVANLSNAAFRDVATNLLAVGAAQGFSAEVLSPEAAYSSWTGAETYKLGVYQGFFWNTDATNKIMTFATSVADTALVWIDGKTITRNIGSRKDAGGNTYFAALGEATLKPGPNEFMFLLGHFGSGSKGPRSDKRPEHGLNWEANCGIMYCEGSCNVTNSSLFSRIADSGDGSLLTLTKQLTAERAPAGATYIPRFDSLRFGSDDAEARVTLDLGGLAGFPQNGLTGCPCITNGTLLLSGAWTFTAADIAAHPLEVAAGAGVSFDNATLSVSAASVPLGGTAILHAEPGATVTGLPALSVTDGGNTIWEIRREEIAGAVDLVLYGRKRGTMFVVR